MEGNLEVIKSLRDLSKNHGIWTLSRSQANQSQRMDLIWTSNQPITTYGPYLDLKPTNHNIWPFLDLNIRNKRRGAWVAQLVKPLPSAQVMIPESWDRAPHRAP